MKFPKFLKRNSFFFCMADMIIIGSIGLDDITTPFGTVTNAIGGSATYASYAASFFTERKIKLGLVAIAGQDLPTNYFDLLKNRNIDLTGVVIQGKNFRWSGKYEHDMQVAHTLKTELNSLMDFQAELPEEYKSAKYILLANNPPALQLKVLSQLKQPKFVMLDSMNLWIENQKEQLLEVIKKVDALVINDGEARMLFNTVNLVQAARQALKLGIKYCIIKKGEHGALLFAKENKTENSDTAKEHHFSAPAYPLEVIKDPTGCGDCFAGGMLGYLASIDNNNNNNNISNNSNNSLSNIHFLQQLKKAIIYGSVVASFNAEEFSLGKLQQISLVDIEKRYKEFEAMREF